MRVTDSISILSVSKFTRKNDRRKRGVIDRISIFDSRLQMIARLGEEPSRGDKSPTHLGDGCCEEGAAKEGRASLDDRTRA